MRKTVKKFIVLHNLLDIDRYIFPGCKSGVFHRPEQWPDKVKEKLSISETIAKKHSLKLLKGEIVLEEEITKLEIEAESAYKIQKFYEEWGVELNFLKIEESEICMKSEKETNVNRNKISIKFGSLKIVEKGKIFNFYNEDEVAQYMKNEKIDITVDLNAGKKNFTVYTMDLTKKYVDINADYRS